MGAALEAARRGLASGQPPVGACLVIDDDIVCATHTEVISHVDPSAHAEIQAIREACRILRRLDLSGARLYVTVEPCAMCTAACAYAGVEEIVFGAPLSAMQSITGREIPAGRLLDRPARPQLTGGLMAEACEGLLRDWAAAVTRSDDGE